MKCIVFINNNIIQTASTSHMHGWVQSQTLAEFITNYKCQPWNYRPAQTSHSDL